MSDYTRLAHQAVTEGVNLKYVEKMRKALYEADAELTSLRAELEQARKERDEERALRRQEYDTQERYRDTLERVLWAETFDDAKKIVRDALAGKGQT